VAPDALAGREWRHALPCPPPARFKPSASDV
jgi:hypothetical protein